MNVLFMSADKGGCGWYRIIQPCNFLGSKINTALFIRGEKDYDIAKAFEEADIIVAQRVAGKYEVEAFKMLQKKYNKKIVIDFDDNFYAVENSKENSKYYLDVEKHKEKLENMKELMKEADAITVTTEYLGKALEEFNENIFIIPNSIDTKGFKKIRDKKTPNKKLRIGFAGGLAHVLDLEKIVDPIEKIMKKHDVEFHILGYPEFVDLFDNKYKDRIILHPVAPLEYFIGELADLNLDIGICPLRDTEFNKCKSELKYLEYTSLGVATVAQNILPYKGVIKNNKNGILAKTSDEWFNALDKLITDKELRKTLVNKAIELIEKDYSIEKNTKLYTNLFLYLTK